MNLLEARAQWHRKLGAETTQPCPSERECRAFDAGFKAAADAEWNAAIVAASKVADARRTAPGRLIGTTWQEPVHQDGAHIASKILALRRPGG